MTRYLSLFFGIIFLLISCTENPIAVIEIPQNYDTAGYEIGTIFEVSLRNSLKNLVDTLKTARKEGVVLNYQSVAGLLAPITSSCTDSFSILSPQLLQELTLASGSVYDPMKTPEQNKNGGVYGGYLFNQYGIELEQLLDKMSYISLFYHQASRKGITALAPHQYTALFGAHPTFPNSDIRTVNPDKFSAAYAARRDKNDGLGFYSQAKNALIRVQAYTKGGSSYNEQNLKARKDFFYAWEKAIMATVINYCYAAHAKFTVTNPTDTEKAAALHAISECIGFIAGFQSVTEKKILNSEIDSLLTLLQSKQPSVFVTNPFAKTPRILEAISTIQNIYSFSNQELEDFKVNWVQIQQRQ